MPRDADLDTIKKAYRKLAREHHPDMSKAPGTEARFKAVGEASATLKDPERELFEALATDSLFHQSGTPPEARPEHATANR